MVRAECDVKGTPYAIRSSAFDGESLRACRDAEIARPSRNLLFPARWRRVAPVPTRIRAHVDVHWVWSGGL